MTVQKSVAVNNARLDANETAVGTAPKLRFYSGAQPANCAAARTGTLLAELTLPSDWMNAASSGTKTKLGTWSGTGAAGAGGGTVIGHYALMDSAGSTCHEQGSVGANVALTTNALTAANGNVLNFASTTGVVVGMNAAGTGIPAGATVVALTGTTVTLSNTSTAGVANAAAITFSYDLAVDNANIATGQAISVSSFQWTAGNA